MNTKHRGFTLIELLIVVAIIAILAAIAVPNFLEAQARAKITRTKSDMRTLANGYEAYRIDHGDIPSLGRYGPYYLKVEPNPPRGVLGHLLTSPIAYLADIPTDYYNSKARHSWNNRAANVSVVVTAVPKQGDSRAFPTFLPYIPWPGLHGKIILYQYVYESAGPKQIWWSDVKDGWHQALYDPTNGTVSAGNIMYFDAWGFGTGYGEPGR